MSVRAKMTCTGGMRGTKGDDMFFGAVYEGSNELQQVSENSMFGDATPSGNLHLSGKFPFDKFLLEGGVFQGEIYVDMYDLGEPEDASTFITRFPVRKVYQGDPQTPGNMNPVAFRYVSVSPELHAELYMGIANPKAIGWLDARDSLTIVLRKCDGKRSAAEIAVLEKMLAEAATLAKEQFAVRSFYRWKTPDGASYTEDEVIERLTYHTRQKLDKAGVKF